MSTSYVTVANADCRQNDFNCYSKIPTNAPFRYCLYTDICWDPVIFQESIINEGNECPAKTFLFTRLLRTQSRIICAVRGAHSQLWATTLPVFSPYAPRKYDMRFGTPAIV